MPSELLEFKGHPCLKLTQVGAEEGSYGFVFGVGKAKLILDNIKDIAEFVKKYDQPNVQTQAQ